MTRKISRRRLLKALVGVSGVAGLCKVLDIPFLQGVAQALDEHVYLPLIGTSGGDTPTPTATATPSPTPTNTPTPTPTATHTPAPQTPIPPPTEARVVHVHNEEATFWNGQTDYWNYVDQDAVHAMVDQGMMALTGTSSVAAAWRLLLPDYQPGQAIAIKVNLNNAPQCDDADNQIDALIHPVNSVVRGLKQIGVLETDIWVYDAVRAIPARFVAASQYDNIRYYGRVACGHDYARFDSDDTDAHVAFSPPSGIPLPPPIKITDVLIDATYLINMPIMKTHGGPGVTLGFKNHLGTIDRPADLHVYVSLRREHFRTDYNPMVDVYRNPHVVGKTILTIGDGLFAAKDNNTAPPSTWQTFGDQVPSSLFFATDSVAADCVMCDFLAAETEVPTEAASYLQVASDGGLGVFERGDPWGSGYTAIDYVKTDL